MTMKVLRRYGIIMIGDPSFTKREGLPYKPVTYCNFSTSLHATVA